MIVLATGFDVVRFLAPIDVRGRSGRTLRETWGGDDARGLPGHGGPRLPELLRLYGPNTRSRAGSLMFMLEIQMRYVATLLQQMVDQQHRRPRGRQDVHEDYNERVDRAHESTIWTHPGFDTYYRNSRGRIVVNSPWRNVDFWQLARTPDLTEYVTEQRRVPVA